MERPGGPAAGPRVTVTETNWATSGVRPVPLSITSRRRIVCGPEASDKRNAFTLTCEVQLPSTETSTWPAFGEDGAVPGAVRLKFDATKTTATGLPFPMTALFAGDTIDNVGGDAAREVDAVTWNVIEADTSGLSGVSSLFTSRIVRTWSPSGSETRKPGSYWASSSITPPSRIIWRCPSFGAFACPCGSTRVKFETWNEMYTPWPVRSSGFGETIPTVGMLPAGPCVATTRRDALTSGVNGAPSFPTSRNRIVCGPEASGSTIGSTRTSRRAIAPSTKTLRWPSFGATT